MRRWIKRFLRRRLESSSGHTLRAYAQNLETLAAFLDEHEVRHPRDVTHRRRRACRVALNGRGLKRATTARYLAAVRAFFRFLLQQGVIENDPARALRTPSPFAL